MDKNSYEICYNLLLTQLTLGKVEACLALLPRAIELAGSNPPAIARAGSIGCRRGARFSGSCMPC